MKAFLVMGRTLRAAYDELFLCVYMSVLWWIGTILILPAAPVMLGMNHVANRIANYKRVDNSFFWQGARSEVRRGWLLYFIAMLMPLAVTFNIFFYFNSASWLRFVGLVWLWVLLLILLSVQYVFPLFWQQEEPNMLLVLRNALILALRHPIYTVLMLIFLIALIALSTVLALPLLLLTPALLALAANFGLVGLLQEMGLADQPPEVSKR